MGKPASLAKEQQRALDRLRSVPGIDRFYLAGGSAVGYHLAHRTSADLDLFSDTPGADLDAVRAALQSALPDTRVLSQTDAALRAVVEGIPIDVVSYPYPPLDPPQPGPAGFRVAGLLDLAAMKLSALARRGLRRDFWDLHAILQSGMSLRQAGAAYLRRFGLAEPDLYHVMRALTYFDDAERDHAPSGLSREQWERIKAFFVAEAPLLLADRDP